MDRVPHNLNAATVNPELYERLCRAREFIDRCYDRPLDLAQISNQACLSRYHFLRLFRQAFNRTPHQYLTQKRIERAKELLTTSELTVTDVCFEVGFESLGSFSSLFHKHVGHAPIVYRTRAGLRSRSPLSRIPGCFVVMLGLDIPRTTQV
jgi:transcriptional regulator GlxA family with amidase domain